MDEDPAPRILLTWPETESLSSIVIPRIIIEGSLFPPATGLYSHVIFRPIIVVLYCDFIRSQFVYDTSHCRIYFIFA